MGRKKLSVSFGSDEVAFYITVRFFLTDLFLPAHFVPFVPAIRHHRRSGLQPVNRQFHLKLTVGLGERHMASLEVDHRENLFSNIFGKVDYTIIKSVK